MTVLYIYLSLILLGLLFVFSRRETSLLRGVVFLKFNLIFLLFAVGISVIRGGDTAFNSLITISLITIITLLVKNKWLLFKYDSVATKSIITESLSRVLLTFQDQDRAFIIHLPEEKEARIELKNLRLRCAIINFQGDFAVKKVEVFRNLLKKKFSGVFPKIVIRLK